MNSVVSQKSMVVKTKQISWFRWLVKKVWWLKQNRFRISVVSQKSMVVKTKQFSWFWWLVKKVWWLKPNSFRDFGG